MNELDKIIENYKCGNGAEEDLEGMKKEIWDMFYDLIPERRMEVNSLVNDGFNQCVDYLCAKIKQLRGGK